MSVFSNMANGLSKGVNFILAIFTKTAEVEKVLVSIAPATKAAVLASAYDVLKTIQVAEGAAAAAATGNLPITVVLSTQTVALVRQLFIDAKVDGSVAANDLKALGI